MFEKDALAQHTFSDDDMDALVVEQSINRKSDFGINVVDTARSKLDINNFRVIGGDSIGLGPVLLLVNHHGP